MAMSYKGVPNVSVSAAGVVVSIRIWIRIKSNLDPHATGARFLQVSAITQA
jgi:hypothetical protein